MYGIHIHAKNNSAPTVQTIVHCLVAVV